MEIIGHQEIRDFFAKVIASGNLSHAYCFVGPDRVGKMAVAESIASELLGVEKEKLLQTPDFFVVEQMFDEKMEKTKKDITVEQMRGLKENFSHFSFAGGYKVALIDEAEKMNTEAGNALLKTLEEPAGKAIIFLITSREDRLPETVKSRCQTIYFQTVADDLIKSRLLQSGVEEKIAEEMTRLSGGRPGQALYWLAENEEYIKYKNEVERFVSLVGKPFYEKLKLIEDLFGDKSDHIAERENLQNILCLWQVLVRDGFLQKQGWDKLAVHRISSDWNDDLTIKIYEKLEQAKTLLKQNIHPRLLVENILLLM